jgi:hypothetical protein
MVDDPNKKLIDAIEQSNIDADIDAKLIRKEIDTQTAVLGNAIMNLQKQGKDQNIKDSKISLKENLGSLLEVQATFKAQKDQVAYEKKENIDQVDDILGKKTKEDRKWYGSMLDFMRIGAKGEDQLSAQQTEKTKKDNAKSKMEFKTLKKIKESTTGMLKSMLFWDKLKGAAKFTFFGALMAGFMVALIKLLEHPAWQDFKAWIFSPTGLSKKLKDWGMSWETMYLNLFATEGGGGGVGSGSGPFTGPNGKKSGFFPWIISWGVWLYDQFIAWSSGVMTLFGDVRDKLGDKPGAKSWKQILMDAFDVLWHPGLGVFAALAVILLPRKLLAGLWVAGKWLFIKPLMFAIRTTIGALKGLGMGIMLASGAATVAGGAKYTKGALKPGSVNKATGRLVGVDGRDTTIRQGDKGFKAARSKIKGIGRSANPQSLARAMKDYKTLFKVAKRFWPLSMIIGGYQGVNILMSDMNRDEKIHALGGLVGQTLGGLGFGALGAVIGSAIPIPLVGTAIGAITGGMLGAYGGEWAGRKLVGLMMGDPVDKNIKDFAETQSEGAAVMKPSGTSTRPPQLDSRANRIAGKSGQQGFLLNQKRKAEVIKRQQKMLGRGIGGFEPPRPVSGMPNYRRKWQLRNAWLNRMGKDPEPYLATVMPENYMSHLNDNQARAKYGGSVYRPSTEEMWKKDNPIMYSAPTITNVTQHHLSLAGTRSGSESATTEYYNYQVKRGGRL